MTPCVRLRRPLKAQRGSAREEGVGMVLVIRAQLVLGVSLIPSCPRGKCACTGFLQEKALLLKIQQNPQLTWKKYEKN